MDSPVTIIGNCTRDPELRYTPSGIAQCQVGVAVNRRWQNKTTNEWNEETSFFNVILWQKLAENAAESIAKGQRVVVYGELRQRSYENTEGEKRNVVEIIAQSIGPDLRWATAQVTRNEKQGGGGYSAPADADQGRFDAPGSGSPFGDDEEPF